MDGPTDDASEVERNVQRVLENLRRIAADEAEPSHLRRLASVGIELLTDMRAASVSGRHDDLLELYYGPDRESPSARPGGILQKLPLWARGTAQLAEIAQFVDVDETVAPPSVTVHWERVPRNRRREVASLASELVDRDYVRPKGGRPRKTHGDSKNRVT